MKDGEPRTQHFLQPLLRDFAARPSSVNDQDFCYNKHIWCFYIYAVSGVGCHCQIMSDLLQRSEERTEKSSYIVMFLYFKAEFLDALKTYFQPPSSNTTKTSSFFFPQFF
ncbi:hypothetical protein AB205_0205470 [Aquarana catesbeiana]|uniref:Uncharacterized protein n=1 Tax=Aquarana catesbeiana TaxID=8400 RepID=A0A2G9RSB7_AQUCT|nr:hypothetical protein AB205_0205470 [Aquarana catesbeiana]